MDSRPERTRVTSTYTKAASRTMVAFSQSVILISGPTAVSRFQTER
jgi:hypothetical protein